MASSPCRILLDGRTCFEGRLSVIQQVKSILESDLKGLGRNKDKPVDILILPLYKQQLILYQQALKHMVDTHQLPIGVMAHVKAKTLDDAQGDEADFVFGDYVAVSHPGFTSESFRRTLVTTRARGITVVLLNRGTFVGLECNKKTEKRALELYRFYTQYASQGLAFRIWSCLNCDSPGHTEAQCTEQPRDMSGIRCERESCGKAGHLTAKCPMQQCKNCRGKNHAAKYVTFLLTMP